MLFTNLTFIYFHLAVVLLRWVLPPRAVGPLLLLSSYVFYLSWGPKYGLLIFGMTLVTWGAGLALAKRERGRKALVASIVSALLLVLAYFKYANFLSAQWAELLAKLGVHHAATRFDVVLPLGISFFTFEMISYVVDVYRGDRAEPSLWRFSLYIAYYPHLIAGPIVRAGELLPNLRKAKRFDGDLFSEGVFVALVGYLKKMVIADNLSPFADDVFASPDKYSSFGVWLGVLAYTGQIYCDFSGYTDIARGASMTLGYPLPDNFDYPYASRSITEFWRRWHMTLSRWLRDYLYISLGGNRAGRARQYVNLFLTMLLGGLWHGANWTFVAWGAFHGALLAVHKLWDSLVSKIPGQKRIRASLPYQALAIATTLLLVMFGWVWFRAPTFAAASAVFSRMFHAVPGVGEIVPNAVYPEMMMTAIAFLAMLGVVHVLGHFKVGLESNRALPPIGRGLLWAAIVLVCWLYAESRAQFIYFQF
jgi:D-alanyl-lipoteichoic acid acyltransferase DltB (MBOAT superfamily)